jgi:hypothetical protein
LVGAAAILTTTSTTTTSATESSSRTLYNYEGRDRQSNRDAVIREDYWYMTGRVPPRLLDGPVLPDDPQWNAFGSCVTQGGVENSNGNGNGGTTSTSNSCTYVPLKQRSTVYSRYGFGVALGSKEYASLGRAVRDGDWALADSYLGTGPSGTTTTTTATTPVLDAPLKMVLLASGLLTSPNYSGPNRRLLVARFYANEVQFAVRELREAVDKRENGRAVEAYEFGKDSWNSYYRIVNDAVSTKVGDRFEYVP